MEKFKVICKVPDNQWEQTPRPTKIVNSGFWLWKSTKIVDTPNPVPGPVKDEICIVIGSYIDKSDGCTYYNLAGYPYGGYNSKYFIPLDEIEETEKEETQEYLSNYKSTCA